MRKEDKPFSGTEVGTLIESFRSDIAVIAEGQQSLREDVGILTADVKELKSGMVLIKDVFHIFIPQTEKQLTRLEEKFF